VLGPDPDTEAIGEQLVGLLARLPEASGYLLEIEPSLSDQVLRRDTSALDHLRRPATSLLSSLVGGRLGLRRRCRGLLPISLGLLPHVGRGALGLETSGVGLGEHLLALFPRLLQDASRLLPVDASLLCELVSSNLSLAHHPGGRAFGLEPLAPGFVEQLVGLLSRLLQAARGLLTVLRCQSGSLRRGPLRLGPLCRGLLEELADLLSVELTLPTREVVEPTLDLTGLELNGVNLEP
jgi:hypothetical protein